MRIINKTISMSLALIIFILASSATTFAWPWSQGEKPDICEKQNDIGGLYDLGCIYKKADNLVRNGEPYVFFDKVGRKGNQAVHVFELSKAAEIISNLKPISNIKENYAADGIIPGAAAAVAAGIGAGFAGILTKYYNKNGAEWLSSKAGQEYKPLSFLGVAGIIAATAVTFATLTWTSISAHLSRIKSDSVSLKEIKIDNYDSSLDQILAFLRFDTWKDIDSVSIEFDNDPQHYSASPSFLNLGRNYTDSEKQQYIADLKASVEAAKIDLLNRRNQWEE
ncbi:MAG: hypothetical protein RUMPE_00772 [Eubacteriales bacterium SKADARSKE-1]|nr:hypothetical protein [Eubacteriales bacterium SKADARSKE-1]